MNPEIQALTKRIEELETRIYQFAHSDRFTFSRDVVFGKRVLGIPIGQVAIDGSKVYLPYNWSSANTTTGDYTITHNMGTTNFIVVASPIAEVIVDALSASVSDITTTTFRIRTFDIASNSDKNVSFYFAVFFK